MGCNMQVWSTVVTGKMMGVIETRGSEWPCRRNRKFDPALTLDKKQIVTRFV